MRLWTVHPKYLDARGLVALWREGLLAQKVIRGGTRGYTRHPQLTRFRNSNAPAAAIASYLTGVHAEAKRRGYSFDSAKIPRNRLRSPMSEARGQLIYEWRHLLAKLKRRDAQRFNEYRSIRVPAAHPLFRITPGGIAAWERVPGRNRVFGVRTETRVA